MVIKAILITLLIIYAVLVVLLVDTIIHYVQKPSQTRNDL